MPSLCVPRRLKLYRKFLLWILLASLLPTILLLAFSYHRLISDARESLENRVDRAYREVGLLLEDAETILSRIALAVENEAPAMLNILQRAIYQSSYFREAGIIDEKGFLTLTNLGTVEPPVWIPPPRRSDPSMASVQLIGPHKTTVMKERSIILSLPTADDGEVNLLVNPNILLYFLDVVDETSLGPDGFIAFVNSDEKIIVADGIPPQNGHVAMHTNNNQRLRVTLATPDGMLKVMGEISTDWTLRHWNHQVMVGVPLAVLSAFLLLSIFLFLFRRAQAFDHDLEIGLKNNEFELNYQPIIDMKTGECAGSETLIRWRHPDEGMLLPNLFIPAAEKTGIIGAIGEWVVKQAVKEQGRLLKRFPLMYISINLSPVQLNSGSFENIIRWLPEAPLASMRLMLEVTEEAIIRETQTTAMDTLARLRNLGCKVALDDFGTGYSSLGHLHKFEFDFLKIDKQFIKGIDRDIRTNSILKAMIELGHTLGVKIIAEGVETEEQREFLQKLGVHYAQGWLFSRPLPIHELERYLSR